MFGYVRPDAPELKIKEFERFRACYCGLCHVLGDKFGVVSRFFLNYDFVFLAMLLWENDKSDYCFRRCAAAFCRKRCVSSVDPALEISAGYSVILTYFQLCDCVNDDKGFKALSARVLRVLLKRGYLKAAKEYPEFNAIVAKQLSELSQLEKENEMSMDRVADKFAALLASASNAEETENKRRALEQLLYHIGRIIYIADAYNDIESDLKDGQYNPVVSRFGLTSSDVPQEVSYQVASTLDASCVLAASAYELLPQNYWSSVIENIIYRGIPNMCRQVIAGTYDPKNNKLPKHLGKSPGRMEKNK